MSVWECTHLHFHLKCLHVELEVQRVLEIENDHKSTTFAETWWISWDIESKQSSVPLRSSSPAILLLLRTLRSVVIPISLQMSVALATASATSDSLYLYKKSSKFRMFDALWIRSRCFCRTVSIFCVMTISDTRTVWAPTYKGKKRMKTFVGH